MEIQRTKTRQNNLEKENQTKTTMRYSFTPNKEAIIKDQ